MMIVAVFIITFHFLPYTSQTKVFLFVLTFCSSDPGPRYLYHHCVKSHSDLLNTHDSYYNSKYHF